MTPSTWGQRPGPESGSALVIGRRGLSAALHDGARPPDADEGAVERLLLVYEELTSNALRHGRRPVEVTLASVAAEPACRGRLPLSAAGCRWRAAAGRGEVEFAG